MADNPDIGNLGNTRYQIDHSQGSISHEEARNFLSDLLIQVHEKKEPIPGYMVIIRQDDKIVGYTSRLIMKSTPESRKKETDKMKWNETLDLHGPEGNAFFLFGIIKEAMIEQGEPEQGVKMFIDSLMRGKYPDIVQAVRTWRPDIDIINQPTIT